MYACLQEKDSSNYLTVAHDNLPLSTLPKNPKRVICVGESPVKHEIKATYVMYLASSLAKKTAA